MLNQLLWDVASMTLYLNLQSSFFKKTNFIPNNGSVIYFFWAAQMTSCELLGGYCRVPISERCPFGHTLPGYCEIHGRCCMCK